MKIFKKITLFFLLPLIFDFAQIYAQSKSILVYRSNKDGYKAKTVHLVEGESAVNIPEAEYEQFEKELRKFLFEQPKADPIKRLLFTEGQDLKIEYRFTKYEEGSASTRYWTSGTGLGKGTVTVEAKFFDANGKQVAFIQSEGVVGDPSMLGFDQFEKGMRGAVRRSARGIAEYANANFLFIPPKTEEQKEKEKTGHVKGLKLN